jgi:hypothetical protein
MPRNPLGGERLGAAVCFGLCQSKPYSSLLVKQNKQPYYSGHQQSLLVSNRKVHTSASAGVVSTTALKAADVVKYEDCDPYDPESSEFCTNTEPIDGGIKRTIRLTTLYFL